jgi:antitoxin HicB
MRSFTYPFRLVPDKTDGGYTATCRDIPEAITQGESVADALAEAADCLDEALHAYMAQGRAAPTPSRVRRGEYPVSAPIATALKYSIWEAMRVQRVSNANLARRLGMDEKEIRRTLDPHHGTRVPTLEAVLHALGARVEVNVV